MSTLSCQCTLPKTTHEQGMDLLDRNQSLIHTDKFLQQSETGFQWNGWTELFSLLFDYCESSY